MKQMEVNVVVPGSWKCDWNLSNPAVAPKSIHVTTRLGSWSHGGVVWQRRQSDIGKAWVQLSKMSDWTAKKSLPFYISSHLPMCHVISDMTGSYKFQPDTNSTCQIRHRTSLSLNGTVQFSMFSQQLVGSCWALWLKLMVCSNTERGTYHAAVPVCEHTSQVFCFCCCCCCWFFFF